MDAGKVKGMLCIGQNPATSINAKLERSGLRKLEWLVVKDNWLTETATFWKTAPEIENGEVKTADIKTEVFFFPATQVAEARRHLHQHPAPAADSIIKAAEAPGDCRIGHVWFTYDLGKRLKKLYANRPRPRDQGFKNLVWDFEHENRSRAQEGRAFGLKDSKGDQRLFYRRPGAPLRRFRRSQGRWFDDLRVLDLLGRLSGRRTRTSPTDAHPTRPANPARNSTGDGHGRRTAG